MKAIEYLKSLPREWLPKSVIRGCRPVSNSELVRWLKSGGVIINETAPKPLDSITFPVKQLIFFPSSKRKATIVQDEGQDKCQV